MVCILLLLVVEIIIVMLFLSYHVILIIIVMFLFAYHVTLELQSSLGVEQAKPLKEMPQIVAQWISNITSPVKKEKKESQI